MTDPLVTVIIPCFSHVQYLGESIESALAQDYPHVEIVVVDDGSPEHPDLVVQRYPTVTLVRQANRGISSARNHGLRVSGGEFIVFLDADDRLTPGSLRAGVTAMQEGDDIGAVFGNIVLIDPKGLPLAAATSRRRPVGRISYLQLLEENVIGPPITAMFRRSAVEAVSGFDESIRFTEDFELYLRVARQFAILGHGQLVGEYRRHPQQLSNQQESMLEWHLKVLNNQAQNTPGDPAVYQAVAEGQRRIRAESGSHILLSNLSQHVRNRRLLRAIATAAQLLIRYPRRFLENLSRKVGITVKAAAAGSRLGPSRTPSGGQDRS